jgi:predicted Rossmann-fold nucleotide-binding protein
MEAANRGASEAGAPTIGLNIRLPREQVPNAWITPGLAFRFHYFALRKMHFLLRARAMVAFPGGFGTLDEVYEALNLIATGTIEAMPIVLVGHEYWSRMLDLEYLVSQGLISPAEAALVHHCESGAEAASFVLARCGCAVSPPSPR